MYINSLYRFQRTGRTLGKKRNETIKNKVNKNLPIVSSANCSASLEKKKSEAVLPSPPHRPKILAIVW